MSPFSLRALLLTLALTLLTPSVAFAFCGVYVSGDASALYNEKTEVALLREGTKTVLSMRNSYRGPAEDFAMLVPVPVVLQQDDVKVLSADVFDKLERFTQPRLVEYSEHDPCDERLKQVMHGEGGESPGIRSSGSAGAEAPKIEAQFVVGEYEMVILSAKESTTLETWLEAHHYNIPKGAGEVLQSYIAQGMYFFVAKVDAKKVTFDLKGNATLSPLRFSYDSDNFQLPIRLGLINSSGTQDLLVYILSREGRYEAANYENAFIPTNLIVSSRAESRFPVFYEALFQDTLTRHPKSVVTEYAWQQWFFPTLASRGLKCDPCTAPTPTGSLTQADLLALGADQWLPFANVENKLARALGWTLTRLHARYGPDELGEDLIFRRGVPIRGGNTMPTGKYGKLAQKSAEEHKFDQFQARYITLQFWPEAPACRAPKRYVWGPPPPSNEGYFERLAREKAATEKKRAHATERVSLEKMVRPGELKLAREAERAWHDE